MPDEKFFESPVDGDAGGGETQAAADARGVYGIAVAAELAGTGVQNLRAYEKRGLLEPARTEGGTRRYSVNDLHRLRRIARLLAEGLNLAGIARVLDLEDDNDQLRRELHQPDPSTERPATEPTTATAADH